MASVGMSLADVLYNSSHSLPSSVLDALYMISVMRIFPGINVMGVDDATGLGSGDGSGVGVGDGSGVGDVDGVGVGVGVGVGDGVGAGVGVGVGVGFVFPPPPDGAGVGVGVGVGMAELFACGVPPIMLELYQPCVALFRSIVLFSEAFPAGHCGDAYAASWSIHDALKS